MVYRRLSKIDTEEKVGTMDMGLNLGLLGCV